MIKMVQKSQALMSKTDIVASYRAIIKAHHKIARVDYHKRITLRKKDYLTMLLKKANTEWRKML
jgi:cell division protein FtsL